MNIFKCISILALFVLASPGVQGSTITFTPGDCDGTAPDLTCWTTNDNSSLKADELEALVGTSADLLLLYKQDVGGGESGLFTGSYETSFSNSELDPTDALIEFIAGNDPIICDECYLLIKDGNHSPAQYIFDLAILGWDGMMTLALEGFWPAGGAISHVSIWGTLAVIPIPAAFWLFGTALIGFIGISRRTAV